MTGTATAGRADLDVLIPTGNRAPALAVTVTALLASDVRGRLVVADQTPEAPSVARPEIATVLRLLELRGWRVEVHHRTGPRLGVAEQRQFLLDRAEATYALVLDDDVLLERWALGRMLDAISTLGCGFVGMAMAGSSYLDDVRPDEHQAFELWDSKIHPERVRKDTPGWDRWRLHNAANPHHLAERLPPESLGSRGWVAYKVAWIAGCVMFRTASLRAVGGFRFWERLPPNLRGEDVAAQLQVLERDGGAGLLPSGAWHLELPTSIEDRSVDAYTEVLERPQPD